MHHIVSDAWSMGVLIGEVVELYEGYAQDREVEFPPCRSNMLTFAVWQA
jgi:hypothetical protein